MLIDDSSHKDRAKLVGQLIDGAFEELAELALSHSVLRVRGLVAGQGEGNDLGCRWRHRIRRSGGELSPASDPLQCLVEHDAAEPSGEARISPELGQRREPAEIGLLQHVLGFAIVADHAARDAVEASIVRLDDGANGGVVLAYGAVDEFAFRRPVTPLDLRLSHNSSLLHIKLRMQVVLKGSQDGRVVSTSGRSVELGISHVGSHRAGLCR
jgi:hypothetical protein